MNRFDIIGSGQFFPQALNLVFYTVFIALIDVRPQVFIDLENLRTDISLIEEAELFEYAFSMAVLMMIDVFSFKEKQLAEQGNE